VTTAPAPSLIRPLHYTQYLAGLLVEGRLPALALATGMTVTYHDPCTSAASRGPTRNRGRCCPRSAGSTSPRWTTTASRRCAAGGGGRLWFDTPREERFAPRRVAEAQATGAEVLATACPACLSCLEDGVKTTGERIAVLDIVELMAQAVRGGRP
jgi:Fe-S oxidoreductase